MGLSVEYARPEWMILTVLPVPPPPVRPSISVDGGAMRSEDDLTYKLGDILKASATVRKYEQEGSPPHVIAEHEQLLQVRFCYEHGLSLDTKRSNSVPCCDIHGQ
jgi:DNA-directed RNA polymerase II subunit RPB1